MTCARNAKLGELHCALVPRSVRPERSSNAHLSFGSSLKAVVVPSAGLGPSASTVYLSPYSRAHDAGSCLSCMPLCHRVTSRQPRHATAHTVLAIQARGPVCKWTLSAALERTRMCSKYSTGFVVCYYCVPLAAASAHTPLSDMLRLCPLGLAGTDAGAGH